MPLEGDVKIMTTQSKKFDYLLTGQFLYDIREPYPSSSIDLTPVMELQGEFEEFEVKSIHMKEAPHNTPTEDAGQHVIEIMVSE